MVLRNLIFDAEASDDHNQIENGRMLRIIMLLLNLILLIEVTFSTPTGGYTQNLCRGILRDTDLSPFLATPGTLNFACRIYSPARFENRPVNH